jgi:hypothetical protein
VLAATLGLFHLGNAAMLPLYGMAVVADKQGDPAGFVAVTIVVAQGTMISPPSPRCAWLKRKVTGLFC